MTRVHVVGTGIAGLSAAERLSAAGKRVVLHDSAKRAGGRCRSYHDARLDRVIDNGSHLILTGNRTVLGLVAAAGARDRVREVRPAQFPFLDLESGTRWRLAPATTRLGALLGHSALPPEVGIVALARDMARLALARPGASVGEVLDTRRPAFRRLWEPLALAALNVAAETGTARGLWAVVRETLVAGEAASRPVLAPGGLSDALVEPLVALLQTRGVEIRFASRLRAIEGADGQASHLRFTDNDVALDAGDTIVLAIPPAVAADLMATSGYPDEFSAIVNLHYRLPDARGLDPDVPFVGLLGGTAEWIFQRGDVASITLSDGNRFLEQDDETLAGEVWRDVARALGRTEAAPPPYRIVKERRATIVQTPAMEARRPGPRTRFDNLALAGDWTDTGVPATIEGAARSGRRAAALLLG